MSWGAHVSVLAEAAAATPVDWAGRNFAQLTPDEQVRVTREAAVAMQAELSRNADALAETIARPGPNLNFPFPEKPWPRGEVEP